MLTFLQQLRRPFSDQNQRKARLKKEKEKKDTEDAQEKRQKELDAEQGRITRMLPLIVDLGRPAIGLCENDDVFWNSVMLKGDAPGHSNEKSTVKDRPVYPYWRYANGQENVDRQQQRPQHKAPKDVHCPPSQQGDRESTQRPVDSSAREQRSESRSAPFGMGLDGAFDDSSASDAPGFTPRLVSGPHLTNGFPFLSRTSKEFEESMCIPTDRPIFVYHDEDGQRRLVFMSSPEEQPAVNAADDDCSSAVQSSSPEMESIPLTWNGALNRILANDFVDSVMKDGVKARMQQSTAQNGATGNRFVSAVDVGLVPNFSYPIAGTAFYDRWVLPDLPGREFLENAYKPPLEGPHTNSLTTNGVDGVDAGGKNWPLPPEGLPNGIPGSSSSGYLTPDSSYSDSTHVRPSGLATTPDIITYRLLSTPSTPRSPRTTIYYHERTIATQAKLISKLHRNIDHLRRKREYYENTLTPQLADCVEQVNFRNGELEIMVALLKEEGEALWGCLMWVDELLRRVWRREREVWRLVSGVREKRCAGGVPGVEAHAQGQRSASSLLRRLLTGRGCRQKARLGGASPLGNTQGTGDEAFAGSRKGSRLSLSDEDLDRFFVLTDENVRVVRGGIWELATRMQQCNHLHEAVRRLAMEEEDVGIHGVRDI